MNPALGLGVLRQRAAVAGLPRIAAARQARSYATKQPSPVVSSLFSPVLIIIHPLSVLTAVCKVLVLAVFTYQVAYWTWTKLEADEHRAEADATIAALESTVNEYKKTKDGKKDMP
ncbi:hypothetical protein Trihar35433_4654 [Trichoderma harzianum]|nr:hypothetical protein Trihar35433_4654 [Trichoderma harzianum]